LIPQRIESNPAILAPNQWISSTEQSILPTIELPVA